MEELTTTANISGSAIHLNWNQTYYIYQTHPNLKIYN
jgi:hypothetical protein